MTQVKRFFITGIGTDVGKTVASACVSEALQADYWKPVQAGDLENSDSLKVQRLAPAANVLPEAFRLTQPMSPHAAAARDGVEITVDQLQLPVTENNLVVEGAGGLLVPFNAQGNTFLDLAMRWKLPVIVVSRHYLGSINHTLLTIELLKREKLEIAGIIFVGNENPETESIIRQITGVEILHRIPETDSVDSAFVRSQAAEFRKKINS